MIEPTGSDTTRFYSYWDSHTNRYYFHNPITNEVCWTAPPSSTLLDPETFQPFQPPPPPARMRTKAGRISPQTSGHRNAVHRDRRNFHSHNPADPPKSKIALARSDSALSSTLFTSFSSQFPRGPSIADYFPATIETDQRLVPVIDFCRQQFRIPKRAASRRPTDLSTDDWLFPDDTLTNIPILKSLDQKLTKSAIKLYAHILGYGQSSPEKSLSGFVALLQSEPKLVDEAYVQVIRQSRHQNPQVVYRMWELLLALATLFVTSPACEPFVRQTMATAAFGQNKMLVDIAQMAYLRFCSQCLLGVHFRTMPPAFIEEIPNHLNFCCFTFGASLRELMYRQRAVCPRMRVPMILHRLATKLIALGVIGAVRAFQLPVDKARVDEIALQMDIAGELPPDANLACVASLLRKWLGDLPEPLVVPDIYPVLSGKKAETWIEAVESMPRIYRDALAYLIGFLKVILVPEQMTEANLGTCALLFGSNCVRKKSIDMKEAKEIGELSKSLFKFLIVNWDVSDVYPMQEGIEGSDR